MSTPTSSTKRALPQTPGTSPSDDNYSKIQRLPGETCKHCNKLCSTKGTSIQCEICYSWVHASCEGISNDSYKMINKLSSSVPNLVYCCKLNECFSRLNQLTSVAHNSATDEVDLKTIADSQSALENSVSKRVVLCVSCPYITS